MIIFKKKFMFSTKEKAIITGLIFSILFSMINFSGKCDKISQKVLRLHIIANSDSEEDQLLKLKVRDAIISYFSKYDLKSLEDTKIFTIKKIKKLESLAIDELNKNGYDYGVKAEILKKSFKTRIYENISLPAGRYESLKITIGNGDGKNWWCVVFPPMCLPAAQDRDVEISDTKVFEKSEKKIINNDNKYEIRFKIVEIFESFHEIISKIFEWTSSIFSKNSSSKSESLENIKTS